MRFVSQRLIGSLLVLFIASLISFFLLRVLPGDPARMILGPLASQEAIENQRRVMGLDLPITTQYIRYIKDLFQGDLGFAWHTGRPVITELKAKIPATAELAIASFLFASFATLLLGILVIYFRGGFFDNLIRSIAFLGLGTPIFWFGLLLLVIFFFYLKIFPAPFGRLSPTTIPPTRITGFYTIDSILTGNWKVFQESISYLALPVFTLSFALFAYLFRVLRGSLLEVINEPYMVVAKAKGLNKWKSIVKHALPNSLLPFITLAALSFGELLAGSVLVETVFLWPGVGSFVTQSVLAKDFAAVQAVIILSAIAYVMVNLIVDIMYGVLNPRIRSS